MSLNQKRNQATDSKQSIYSVATSKLLDQSDIRHPDFGRPKSITSQFSRNKNRRGSGQGNQLALVEQN